MSDPVPAAEAEAEVAKLRLTSTIATLQARLAPKALAQEAAQGLIAKGQDLAQDGIDTAKRHPLPLAGAVAALGLFFARRPIGKLLTRSKHDATLLSPASLNTAHAPAKRKLE